MIMVMIADWNRDWKRTDGQSGSRQADRGLSMTAFTCLGLQTAIRLLPPSLTPAPETQQETREETHWHM